MIRAQVWRSVDKASEPGGEDGWQAGQDRAEICARQTLAKGSEWTLHASSKQCDEVQTVVVAAVVSQVCVCYYCEQVPGVRWHHSTRPATRKGTSHIPRLLQGRAGSYR